VPNNHSFNSFLPPFDSVCVATESYEREISEAGRNSTAEEHHTENTVDTTADWILNNHKLRRFVFYMSTFRERRATIEATRREQI